MKTDDFTYNLPQERIAQRPASPRDSSRLLVLDRSQTKPEHRIFRDIIQYLNPGDVLVINETRVIPARLKVTKIPSGGKAELLLLKRIKPQTWEALVGGKGLNPGREVAVGNGLTAEICENLGRSKRIIRFSAPITTRLDNLGEMPLPPYIHTPLQSNDEYQTIFAKHPGSAAAPTAGLHFTPQVLADLQAKGVQLAKITLHVGLDTFAPVNENDPREHEIHSEWCEVGAQTVQMINAAAAIGNRIIAAGTTSTRTLESAACPPGSPDIIAPFCGPTSLFILPGYQFQVIDGLITNFHLPRSTLLMLVSAFAGRKRILDTYRLAIEEQYRFFSFGDAMYIY